MTPQELEEIIDRAAKRGAAEALHDIGLHDDNAIHDIHELRDLLDSWRSTKKTIGNTITKFITVAILGALASAAWFNWGHK
jgi:2-iminoacetate synthase ThiH